MKQLVLSLMAIPPVLAMFFVVGMFIGCCNRKTAEVPAAAPCNKCCCKCGCENCTCCKECCPKQ